MKTSELDGLLQIAIGFPSPEPYSYKFIFPLMCGEGFSLETLFSE